MHVLPASFIQLLELVKGLYNVVKICMMFSQWEVKAEMEKSKEEKWCERAREMPTAETETWERRQDSSCFIFDFFSWANLNERQTPNHWAKHEMQLNLQNPFSISVLSRSVLFLSHFSRKNRLMKSFWKPSLRIAWTGAVGMCDPGSP